MAVSDLTEHRMRQAVAIAQRLRKAPEVSRAILNLEELTARETLSGSGLALPGQKRLRWKKDADAENET